MRALYGTDYKASSAGNIVKSRGGFVAALDVRTKMVISFLSSLAVIPLNQLEPLSMLLFISLVYLLSIRKFRIILIAYSIISILCGLAVLSSFAISYFFSSMKDLTLETFIVPFLRIAILLNVVLAMAMTSRIQGILSGLKSLKLPYSIYLPAAVMIRFIPVFIKDVSQIRDSLKSKGYNLHPGFICLHPFFTIRLLFVPLVIRALRSADELGVAAELKGIGMYKKITNYRAKSFRKTDFLVMCITLILVGVAFEIQYDVLARLPLS